MKGLVWNRSRFVSSPIRPANPIQGECSKSEVESGQNLPISNPHRRLHNSHTRHLGKCVHLRCGNTASTKLQQMYYSLQLQQQVLQKNQLQSIHSSPSNNSLQEKQQQLQKQMMNYQKIYQMYLQQLMQVQQQQQQHWYQFQQPQMALANAPYTLRIKSR